MKILPNFCDRCGSLTLHTTTRIFNELEHTITFRIRCEICGNRDEFTVPE